MGIIQKMIELFICTVAFGALCCSGLKDPCLSKDRQILDLCEQGMNNNLRFGFDSFKTNWL